MLQTPRIPIALCTALLAFPWGASAGVPSLRAVMDHDPELPTRLVEYLLPPPWQKLWKEALAGPEDDLRLETAAALLRAHQLGCPDLESFTADLLQALAATTDPTARVTIAAALIERDDRESAAALFDLMQAGGLRESLLVEPALAQWDFAPIRDVWLARLADPNSVPRQQLLLAIDGVRIVGETRATDSLHRLVLDPLVEADVRLCAARALGALQSDGLLDDARRLAADPSRAALVDRLIAAHLLASHLGPDSEALLQQLAVDDQSAVAAVAIRRLLEIDEELVQPLVPRLLKNPDATVRQLAARSLIERPSPDAIVTLSRLLDDPHPDVRGFVRRSLFRLAQQEEFDEVVRTAVMEVLSSDGWRGLEQAARLLGELDHEPAASRLVELLPHERDEVSVTAAWALCQLQVSDTLPGMLAFARKLTEDFPEDPPETAVAEPSLTAGQDVCLSHLFQAFGLMRYADCEPMLLKFVPRRYDLGPRSRGAAVWTLGLLHENDPQMDLMIQFGERVADDAAIPLLEVVEVRVNAAIGLGRMNAPPVALEVLQKVYDEFEPGDRIHEACGWAIEKISGKVLPPPAPLKLPPPSRFLQPLRR